MLFAPFGELFASFPQFQRRIEVQPALLQQPHDFDQLVPASFIAKLTNRRNRLGPAAAVVVTSSSLVAIGQPFTHRRDAPSETRTRSRVPAGASSTDRSTARFRGAPPAGTACTTA